MGKLTELVEQTIAEGLSPIAKSRADFNKKLKKNEISDLTDVAREVKRLMNAELKLSFDSAFKQASKKTKVDKKTLDTFMDLYDGEY
jgi:hypothetical protein